MLGANSDPRSAAGLTDAGKWELVQRVAGSAPFQKSARLREFLLFVCDRSLKNQIDDIREQQIGSVVFGRAPDYNPGEDNIVRVEARQLRKRLADYFAGEGKHEPVVITVPKGSYIPVFEKRELAANEIDGAAQEVFALPAPAPEPAPPRLDPHSRRLVPLVVCAVLLAAVAILAWQNLSMKTRLDRAESGGIANRYPWNALFDSGHQTSVVLADSCLVLIQDVTREPITLGDYLNRAYMARLAKFGTNPELRSTLELIASRQYTSLADVTFIGKIMQVSHPYRDKVAVSYARNVNIRDFKANHVILLGSNRANPWVELFEPKLNFIFGLDEQSRRGYFRNKKPQAGEAEVYLTGGADGKTGESYSVIALVPNLNRTGNVLLICGTNMEGTEAGWEFLSDPEFASRVLPALGLAGSSRPKYFEILLRLKAVGGTSKDTEAIAHRIIE